MLGAFDLKDNASMNSEIIHIFKFKRKKGLCHYYYLKSNFGRIKMDLERKKYFK